MEQIALPEHNVHDCSTSPTLQYGFI